IHEDFTQRHIKFLTTGTFKMNKINSKTLQDLEFTTVLQQVAVLCITDAAKEEVLRITPFHSFTEADTALKEVREYRSSMDGDNPIPNHGFEVVFNELKLLGIENSILEIPSFRKILGITETVHSLLSFFDKFKEFYIYLHEKSVEIDYKKEIALKIKS